MATDEELQELKGRLVMAQISNLNADTELKREQRRWEPWKSLSAAFGAGLAVASGLLALAAWVLLHFIK
jgi:hypothetical protein